ncbi:MAG TPA: cellulase family glycosylhydrolase [Pyrinomonadaceae bacterium]|nr:cellulase family glycosylhydrolase [Pyrinomonadaceae bacterium]
MIRFIFLFLLFIGSCQVQLVAQRYVSVRDGNFRLNDRPYYFVGTNYWYGSLLGLEKDRARGVDRLRKELDFLKTNGVTNLRLMAGSEGSGLLNGVTRVGPPLQPAPGKFDERALDGLDLILAEMAKREMKAVVFFSNNWEWSGGFQQYLIWSGFAPADLLEQKPDWEDLKYVVARFYICGPCMSRYSKQVEFVMNRTNTINKRKYVEDPTIMSWELANEPRPMRPAANEPYARWISATAAAIKARDKLHLVTIGHEGSIGTESLELFESVHRDPNIDYLTIHIWPKNWGWFADNTYVAKTTAYIEEHIAVSKRLKKPLVIEEFGLPRDGDIRVTKQGGIELWAFDPASGTTLRDEYYKRIFSYIGGNVGGANFWAFGGTARPTKGQDFWKPGDAYMGDPPMEEQGLNTVFDSDASTWKVIRDAVGRANQKRER